MSNWICRTCNQTVVAMGVLGQREHGRCRGCGIDQNRSATPTLPDLEDQILRDEEEAGLTAEELADGQAQFDAFFPNAIVTRPGESLIATVQAARDEEEPFANDMKPRG